MQGFDEKTRGYLREIRNENVKEIFADMNDAIEEYGEKKGYDYIFSDRALIYKDEKLDITDTILKKINSEYKK